MKNISVVLKGINDKKISEKKARYYIPSGFLRTVYNTDEVFAKTKNLFNAAQESLADVTFNEKIFTSKLLLIAAMAMNNSVTNFDETSELMKKIADESNLRECGKKFVENFGWNDSANEV